MPELIVAEGGPPVEERIPVSASAVGAGIVGIMLGALGAGFNSQASGLLFACSALAGYTGIVTAGLERNVRGAWPCFGLGLAEMVSGIGLCWGIAGGFPRGSFLLIPALIVMTVASLTAHRLRLPEVSAVVYFVAIWLLPGFLALLWLIGATATERKVFSLHLYVGFLLAFPFGPWATEAARLASFPNAGEFFSLPMALEWTAVLGGFAFLAAYRRAWRPYVFIPFAWFILGWSYLSFGQLMSCLN